MVSKPKLSLFTQSRPTQGLPWMIRSSGITWSFTGRPAAAALAGALRSSRASGATRAPPATVKEPDCTCSPAGSRPAFLSRSTAAAPPASREAARAFRTSASIAGTTRSSYA